MNKETIDGLKKRRISLKKKLQRLWDYNHQRKVELAEIHESIKNIENDLEGLNELLAPHETLEKL